MMDNITFYTGTGTTAIALRDQLADLCGVDRSTILLCPALGYNWEEPEFYQEKTLLQWHEYETGDFRLEMEVILGGRRLGVGVSDVPHIFCQLASRLETMVVFTNADGSLTRCDPDGSISAVEVIMPDEYGPTGPVVISISSPSG